MSPRPQPKRWSAHEILQAIAREIGRPRPGGIGLACPREISNLDRGGRDKLVRVKLPEGLLHLRRWADMFDRVDNIEMSGGYTPTPSIRVTGRIPKGPVIVVESYCDDVKLDKPLGQNETRNLSLDELRALDDKRWQRSGGGR